MKKRKDGRYEQVIVTPDGKKTVYGKTKQEVKRKVRDIEDAIENGTYGKPSYETLEDWLNEWQEKHLRHLKPQTERKYRSDIRLHIVPLIGDLRLDTIEPADLQDWVYKLEDSNMSIKSVHNVYGTLHKALDDLCRLKPKKFKHNPCNDVRLPKKVKPELKYLPPEEVPAFLESCKDSSYYELICFAVYSGMRQGEIIALEWKNVDLDSGSVYVARTKNLNPSDDMPTFNDTTKNGKRRLVKIPSKLCTMLRRYKVKQTEYRLSIGAEYHNQDLVFATATGNSLSGSYISKVFRKLADKAGYKDVPFHGLRHTYAVLNIVAGVPDKIITENLGHSTIAFTQDKYAFVSKKMNDDTADKLDNLIENI